MAGNATYGKLHRMDILVFTVLEQDPPALRGRTEFCGIRVSPNRVQVAVCKYYVESSEEVIIVEESSSLTNLFVNIGRDHPVQVVETDHTISLVV
jgi:hypothetical protein